MAQRILFLVKNLYTFERLGVMLLSAMALEKGWETDLVIADNHSYDEILKKAKSFDPDVLAFSVMSPEYAVMETLARRLNADTEAFILFGGGHPTFFQDIIEQPFIHALCFGEGDASFPMFLNKFGTGKNFTAIPGVHFHLNGKVYRNPPAPLVEDLDSLPFPDRALMAKGDPLMAHRRSHIFMASRGCPNSCAYCFNHKYNRMFRGTGRMLRRRSVENLLQEMQEVRDRWGMDFAYIDDDIFTLCPLEWLQEFADKYPQRVGAPFMCNVHANFVNEEKLDCLQRAGCSYVCFGVECGDEKVADEVLRRRIPNERLRWLAAEIRKRKMGILTQNILALPVPHPLEVDLRTLELNIQCKPVYAIAYLFYPLPGTDLEAYARAHGHLPDGASLPERTNSFSALTFADPKEKVRVQRLQKLFGIVVSFPFLRRLTPLLIRLPLGAVYSVLFVLWYGFSSRFRLEKGRKSGKELLFFLKTTWRNMAAFLRRK